MKQFRFYLLIAQERLLNEGDGFSLNQIDNYAGCATMDYLNHPALLRAFMIIASQS